MIQPENSSHVSQSLDRVAASVVLIISQWKLRYFIFTYFLQIHMIFQGPMITLTIMVLPWWDTLSLCFAVGFGMIPQFKQSSQSYYFKFSAVFSDIYIFIYSYICILYLTVGQVCKSIKLFFFFFFFVTGECFIHVSCHIENENVDLQ